MLGDVVRLDYQNPARMGAKLRAIPIPPYMFNHRVLDVGCDAGYWSFLAAQRGASEVLGIDRNREVKNVGFVDLIELNTKRAVEEGRTNVRFERLNLGKQWHEYGKFDVVFCFSMYHHWFECVGDHLPIWFWLSRHCADKGVVYWEGPVDGADPVVRRNVSDANRAQYSRDAILAAAKVYFDCEHVGPALHEPTREVWRFKRLARRERLTPAILMGGGNNGATAAFKYASGRRMNEVKEALGVKPVPGSLNLMLDGPFDWDEGYYRAQLFDVADRSKGFDSEWALRWARLYPLTINDVPAWAFRFEQDRYDYKFMELIAPEMLRERLDGNLRKIVLCR